MEIIGKFVKANIWYINAAAVVFIIFGCMRSGKKTTDLKQDPNKQVPPGGKKKKVDLLSKVLLFIENNVPGGVMMSDFVKRSFVYLFYKPNPVIQILYLIVAGGGFVVYVQVGFVKYCPGPYLAEYHKVTGSIIMFICYYSFYKACTTDPGFINDEK
jgi:hypothetical protein